MNTRVALALVLFFGCAAANVSNVTLHSFAASPDTEVRLAPPPPSPMDLPNDCLIVASEAASRLAATGAWTRIVVIRFSNPQTKLTFSHALAVWQPPTAKAICVYDWHGTIELGTELHDYNIIAAAFCRRAKVRLLEAHFLK